jgi:hypothetical protein
MQAAIKGYEGQVENLRVKNADLNDKIGDLETELAQERE